MFGELDDPSGAGVVLAGYLEPYLVETVPERFIQAVAAPEPLDGFRFSVCVECQASRRDMNILGLAGQRALKPAYEQRRPLRVRLFMRCIPDSEKISGILQQSMLKPASSADERPSSLPAKPDGGQRPAGAPVRASGRTQVCVEGPQIGFQRWSFQRIGRKPGNIQRGPQGLRGVIQGLVGCGV